ncbi:MAG: hypothetical protein ACE5H4_14025 [Candidatus Thorarchaeota archaeon]
MRSASSLVRQFLVAALLLVFLVSVRVNSCDAVVLWSDDFSDGNYDGWTVVDGEWSAANHTLEVVGDSPVDCEGCVILGTIYHESSVTSETWSFDIEYDLDFFDLSAIPKFFFMSTDPEYWNGYCLELQRVVLGDSTFAALRLLRGTTIQGRVGADYTTLG